METMLSTAIICIAIMCWLFSTFYFFECLYDEKNDNPSDKISKFIVAALVGWITTPIILGIKYSEQL